MYKRGFHYRCSHCQARRTLPRRLHEYVRPPRCKSCSYYAKRGKPQRFYWDRHRAMVHMHAPQCTCHVYGFAHRRGSGFCIHNPRERSDEEMARFYGSTYTEKQQGANDHA